MTALRSLAVCVGVVVVALALVVQPAPAGLVLDFTDGETRFRPDPGETLGWEFTVSISHDIDAAAIWPTADEVGFFQMDEYRGYYVCGDYGREHEASFMRYDEAERIIRECVRQYQRASAEVA